MHSSCRAEHGLNLMVSGNPWWVRLIPGGIVHGPVMSALRVRENGVMLALIVHADRSLA